MRRGVNMLLWILVPVAFLVFSWACPDWESSLATFLGTHPLLDGVLFAWTALLLLWWLPKWQCRGLNLSDKERADVENEARKTLAQVLGGVAVLVGLYVSFENLRITQENTAGSLAQSTRGLELARKGHYTQRLNEATGQLGDHALAVRLGGIYTLEQVAKDEEFYWPVMEILTAHVRENARWKEEHPPAAHGKRSEQDDAHDANARLQSKPAADIQAILTTLGRRRRDYDKEDQKLDMTGTDLRGADLRFAHLDNVQLRHAHLGYANLWKASLEKATLRGTHLESADLRLAHLNLADLNEAHLEGARLDGARLEGARFAYAHLERARLAGANLQEAYLVRSHLGGAGFQYANLAKAFLREACLAAADFKDANLAGANLTGALLRNVLNLTVEQLATVKTLYQAQLDAPLMSQVQQRAAHLLEKSESYETELLGLAFEGIDPSVPALPCVPASATSRAFGLRADARPSRRHATLGIRAAYWSSSGKTFSRPAEGTKKIARSAPNSR